MPDAIADEGKRGVPDKENRHVATSASKGENGSALGKTEKKKRRARRICTPKKAISQWYVGALIESHLDIT